MIYVDMKGHMITDGPISELHKFARKLGLKRAWFQNHPKHPHYDLLKHLPNGVVANKDKIAKAYFLGAKVVSSKVIVKILKNKNQQK